MRFFETLLTSLIGLAVMGVEAQQCDVIRSRPSIHNMSQREWDRYVNAVKKLNSGSRPTPWDTLSNMHVRNYRRTHSTPLFLAWHRRYLIDLETQLRKIDNSVRLPYWDWTVHYNNINNDPVWQKYGKNGSSGRNYCVINGSFAGMSVASGSGALSGNLRCSTRLSRFDNVISGHRTEMERLIDSRNDRDFWENFEFGPHGRVHNGIGRDFSGHASPSDPLFYAHHTFIDKIWFDRQVRHPKFTFSYAISGQTPLPGYDAAVYEVYDPRDFCYTYMEDNFAWDKVSMQSAEPEIQVEPFTPLAMAPTVDSANATAVKQAIDEYAKGFVFKDVIAPDQKEGPQHGASGCETIPLPEPLTIEYLNMLGYDEATVRRVERKNALSISELNKRCLSQ